MMLMQAVVYQTGSSEQQEAVQDLMLCQTCWISSTASAAAIAKDDADRAVRMIQVLRCQHAAGA